ncbi:hypothetical protein H0H81_009235, partial [Sphagnurus paluster]
MFFNRSFFTTYVCAEIRSEVHVFWSIKINFSPPFTYLGSAATPKILLALMVEMQAVRKGCALMLLSRGICDGRTKSTHLDETLPAVQLGAGDGATARFLDVDLAGVMESPLGQPIIFFFTLY